MTSNSPVEILSCKVPVRKYLLVSKPSRWGQRGDRVVVQSPVIDITAASFVALKRIGTESVCLLPWRDIEKDSNNIYEKQLVNKTISSVDAHGVAIIGSNTSNDNKFHYERGHTFWLCVGSDVGGDRKEVPVINLKTKVLGMIPIHHVCWYPKVQGPNGEFWTLAGEIRELRLSGKKTFYSFVVCQTLDGSAPTSKSVEIPGKEQALPDRFELSSTDRRSCYEKRFLSVEAKVSAGLITPPSSPEVDYSDTSTHASGLATPTTSSAPNTRRTGVQALRRVVEVAMFEDRPYRMPMISLIHPQELRKSWFSPEISPIVKRTILHDITTIENQDDRTPVRQQPSPPALLRPDIAGCDAADLNVIILLSEMKEYKEQHESTPPDLPIPSTIVPLITGCSTNYSHESGYSGFCDLSIQDCTYSRQFPWRHYHSPGSKCKYGDTAGGQEHHHCISRTCSLPSGAGGCVLEGGFRYHICCHWDRKDWPDEGKGYDSTMQREARNKRQKLYDRGRFGGETRDLSHLVKEQMEKAPVDISVDEDLKAAGRQVLLDIESGKFV